MTTHETYSGKILKGGRGVVAWQRLARFRRAAREIARAAPSGRVPLLVDVGAADGLGQPFWRTCAERTVSVNYYQNHSLEFARSYPAEMIITADSRFLPVPDGTANAVVSLETLHLVGGRDERRRALREIRRVLKADGVFVCSVAVEVGLPALVKYAGRRWSGFEVVGMTVPLMLKHVMHRFCDLSRHDRGQQIGFNAYQFAEDFAREFSLAKRVYIPLPWPLCANLMLVGTPRR